MLELDPNDPKKIAFTLSWAVKQSGLNLTEIAEQLDEKYGVQITVSGLSHSLNREAIRLVRAVQILAICEVTKIQIGGEKE